MKTKRNVGAFDTKETIAARIPISEMVIDDYQGHVNKALVDRMVAKWDDAAAGAIILNLREDNTYAVLDGQHRVLAAKQKNVSELNSLVFIGKTREEEAALFVKLNTKHNVTSIDRFRANLMSGAIREKTIRAVVREVGLEIPLSGTRNKPDTISCVQAMVQVYDNFGVAHLKTVLGVLTSAFHDFPDRARGYSQSALIGTCQFLYRYPQASITRLIERMKTKAPTTLQAMGDAKLDAHSDLWVGWGKMLVSLYNQGYKVNYKGYIDPHIMTQKKYTPTGLAGAKTLTPRRAEALKKAQAASMAAGKARAAMRPPKPAKPVRTGKRVVEMTFGVSKPLSAAMDMAAKAGK